MNTQVSNGQVTSDPVAKIISKLQGVKKTSNGYTARCPNHDDEHNSLSIGTSSDGSVLLWCHANCPTEKVLEAIGLTLRDLYPQQKMEGGGQTIEYDYCDEKGNLLSQVVRSEPKGFRQRRPDGPGNWIWNVANVRRVPYRLPELLAANPDDTVFVAEGEKDVERLIQNKLVATTNPGGAGKWRDEFGAYLQGRHVIILPDNDDAGHFHALNVARSIIPHAASVKILCLPNLPDKGDVSDWLNAGGDRDQLLKMAAEAKQYSPAPLYPIGAIVNFMSEGGEILNPEPITIVRTEQYRDGSWWYFSADSNTGMSEERIELIAEPGDVSSKDINENQPNHQVCAGPTFLLPDILVNHRQMRDVTADALNALVKANQAPHAPTIFVRAGELVRVSRDEVGQPFISRLTSPMLRNRLSDVADFHRFSGSTPAAVYPPEDIASDILARSEWALPPLEALSEAPIVHADGSICVEPGYDAVSRMYHHPGPGLKELSIPDNPSQVDARQAAQDLIEFLSDFPFDSAASKANFMALWLTPFIRKLIDRAPLALLNATAPGSGKGLLADIVCLTATGHTAVTNGVPKASEEWEKTLISLLQEGRPIIVFDNADTPIGAGFLDNVLTSNRASLRRLGTNQMLTLPNFATWIVTGNQLALKGDTPRRCYEIRLDSKMAEPWKRDMNAFKHPNLLRDVTESRTELVQAILTMIRAWILAGKPLPEIGPLASYSGWSEMVGGILQYAGVDGFLQNLNKMYDRTNNVRSEWESFLTALSDLHGVKQFTTAELTVELGNNDALCSSLPEELAKAFDPTGSDKKKNAGFARKLGRAFANQNEMRFGESQIYVAKVGEEKRGKTAIWSVLFGAPTPMSADSQISQIATTKSGQNTEP